MQKQNVMRDQCVSKLATGILIFFFFLFLFTVPRSEPSGLTLFLRAVSEAGMIGGLADWFAVTALFKHPLGLPIPHTALLHSRKEAAADALGKFVQDYVLVPDQIRDKIARSRLIQSLGKWLAEAENATHVAAILSDSGNSLLRSLSVRPLKRLGLARFRQRESPDPDVTIDIQSDSLEPSAETAKTKPSLTRRTVAQVRQNRKLAENLLQYGSRKVLGKPIDQRLARLATGDASVVLDAQRQQSRAVLAVALQRLGEQMRDDAEGLRDLDRQTADLVLRLVKANRDSLGRFVAETLKEWDTDTLVAAIEEQVGNDLQYIRINGALLGAMIGGAIFSLEWVLSV